MKKVSQKLIYKLNEQALDEMVLILNKYKVTPHNAGFIIAKLLCMTFMMMKLKPAKVKEFLGEINEQALYFYNKMGE